MRRGDKMEAYIDGRWRPVRLVTRVLKPTDTTPAKWCVEGGKLPEQYRRVWQYGPKRTTVYESDLRKRSVA